MTLDMAITLVVIVAMVVVLVRELYSPAPTMLAAVVVLVVADVVPAQAGFAGFSSPATLTIAGLFVLARALQVHGGLEHRLARMLGDDGSDSRTMARLVAPVLVSSSVIANTPLVATLAPMVRSWAERRGRAASLYLMPLSFAAILGGVITTIGTSTTLVVSGVVDDAGLGAFGFFEVFPVGLPVALAGGVVLVVLGPRLLPDRRSSYEQVASHERDYTFRLVVQPDGGYDGERVIDAGLRNLEGVYLASVQRAQREITPVPPETRLLAGDVLTFVGRVEHVLDLGTHPGLAHAPETQASLLDGQEHGLVEAIVGANSPLAGRTPKSVSFRGHYGAAIVAIHRQGERVLGKLGEVELRAGDALLLLTDVDFGERHGAGRDFAVAVPIGDGAVAPSSRRVLVGATTVAMVVAASVGVPILTAVLAACLLLVGTRTIRFWEARDNIDVDVLLIVASAIGLGGAVRSSGLAEEIAGMIGRAADLGGTTLALLAVLVGTLVMTELITNVAAAALMVPIALDVANRVDADPIGFAVGVAIMASCSFLTPIGYQTNTIVYGLGGYRFGDYWRLGLPLTVIVLAATTAIIPLVWT